jgi:hypothetical protein
MKRMWKVIKIPDLEPHCGSWVVSRKSGEVIGEFFERSTVEKLNEVTCVVETTTAYLARVNRRDNAKDSEHGRM